MDPVLLETEQMRYIDCTTHLLLILNDKYVAGRTSIRLLHPKAGASAALRRYLYP